jgi:hypothetical protein
MRVWIEAQRWGSVEFAGKARGGRGPLVGFLWVVLRLRLSLGIPEGEGSRNGFLGLVGSTLVTMRL